MSGDEEPDYMSDDFLAQCLPKDVRPGLKRTHEDLRRHEAMKKKSELVEQSKMSKQTKKTKKEMEEENRQEGLQKSLDSSNIGFAMLQRMGYKAGDSLGKTKDAGIKEPISIEVKVNRGGLGREAVMKQVAQAKADLRAKKLEMWRNRKKENIPTAEEFRAQKSKQRRLKQVQTDLYQSQLSCRQLDLAKQFDEPAETWFWPEGYEGTATYDDQEIDDEDVDHQTAESNCQNSDSEDIEHEVEEVASADEVIQQPEEVIEETEEAPCEFEPEEMLSILTGYLRSEHLYCLWCGITFADPDDINSNCPGLTRDDHD